MNEKVRWTNLKTSGLVRCFAAKGEQTSRFIVKQIVQVTGFVKRKMSKTMTAKEVVGRDEQFQYITRKISEFKRKGLPILSVDTKKKEFIGQL